MSDLDPSLIWTYRAALLQGLLITLGLTIFAVGVGGVLGVALAAASRSNSRAVRWASIVYVEFWRNTPLLVQLMWVHFALPFLTGVPTTPIQSGLIGLTLNAAANFAEIVRGGVNAVAHEQWEAARSVGLGRILVWRLVILPQVVRIVLPTLVNMTISIFKGTTIVSILSVGELLQIVNRISNYTFKAVEVFTFAALVYLLIGTVLDAAARRLESRLKEGLAR